MPTTATKNSGLNMTMMPRFSDLHNAAENSPAINAGRIASAKTTRDKYLEENFSKYYGTLSPQQLSQYAPKDFHGGSINDIPNAPEEDQAIADAMTRQNAKQQYMKDIQGKATPSGLTLAAPIGPTESGAALGAPGLPSSIPDDVQSGYSDLDQAYKDAQAFAALGPANTMRWEAFQGSRQANRQIEQDRAQALIDQKIKRQQAAEKEAAANALKDARTKRAMADADLATKKAQVAGEPKAITPYETKKLELDQQKMEQDKAKNEAVLAEKNADRMSRLGNQEKRDYARYYAAFRGKVDRYGNRVFTDQEASEAALNAIAGPKNATTQPATQPATQAIQGTPATATHPFVPASPAAPAATQPQLPPGFQPHTPGKTDYPDGTTALFPDGSTRVRKGGAWIPQ